MSATPTTEEGVQTKKAAMNGLAVVGFGALIIAGIFLAIYAARYVPETLSRLSSAVILSSDEGTTTNEEEPADETPASTDDEEEPVKEDSSTDEEPAKPTTPSTGGPQVVAPQVPRYYTNQPQLYGLADLVIVNEKIGYMRGSTFVEDNEAPDNRDVAVRFSVQNLGTNIANGWRVRIDVEGERPVTGNGGSLMPNGIQNFTVLIENPEEGENLEVEIEADYEDDLNESNERNNDETLDIDIDN